MTSMLLVIIVAFLVFSSIQHWNTYCNMGECEEEYCIDILELCECYNGKLLCDTNMIQYCNYVCDGNEMN